MCFFIRENKKMWLVGNKILRWVTDLVHTIVFYIPPAGTLYCASTQDNLNQGCAILHKDQWNLLEINTSSHEKFGQIGNDVVGAIIHDQIINEHGLD